MLAMSFSLASTPLFTFELLTGETNIFGVSVIVNQNDVSMLYLKAVELSFQNWQLRMNFNFVIHRGYIIEVFYMIIYKRKST